jgi:hypothetical protein
LAVVAVEEAVAQQVLAQMVDLVVHTVEVVVLPE